MNLDVETKIYISIEVIIAVVAVIGNSLVCYVVWHGRSFRNKVMYMFVTSLAVADISVGLIAIPFAILTKLGLPYNSPGACIVMLSFIIVPTYISIFNLTTISIERYLSICHPRLHKNKFTRKRSWVTIVTTWVLSGIVGLMPLWWNKLNFTKDRHENEIRQAHNESSTSVAVTSFSLSSSMTTSFKTTPESTCIFVAVITEDYLLFIFISYVIAFFTSGILYFRIFQFIRTISSINASVQSSSTTTQGMIMSTTRSHAESNETTENNFESDMKSDEINIPQMIPNKNLALSKSHLQIRINKRKKEIHAASVLGIIILCFAICWMPIHILNAIVRFDFERKVQIPLWVFDIAIFMSHANSAVNFFLYSWRLKLFKVEFRKIFSKSGWLPCSK